MFFKKFFVGVLLVFVQLANAQSITLCTLEEEFDEQLALQLVAHSMNEPSLASSMNIEKAFTLANVVGGTLSHSNLFSFIDDNNPEFSISDLQLSSSAKDEKFGDYIKAKIRYIDFKNMVLNIIEPTDKIVEFVNSDTDLQNRFYQLRQDNIVELQEKIGLINETYKGTITLGVGTYTWNEISLSARDTVESVIFPTFDIFFAKYKNVSDGLKKGYTGIKLTFENLNNHTETIVEYPVLFSAPHLAAIGEDSIEILKSIGDIGGNIFNDSPNDISSEFLKINSSLNDLLKNVNGLNVILENYGGTTAKALEAGELIGNIIENGRVYGNYNILLDYYKSNLNLYDERIIAVRKIDLLTNMVADGVNLINLITSSDTVDKYMTYIANGEGILGTLSEEFIGILGVVGDESTNTFTEIRKYQAALDQLFYVMYYDQSFKVDVLKVLGAPFFTYGKEMQYITNSTGSCWDIEIDLFVNDILDIKPIKEEVADVPKPSMMWLIPQNATFEDYQITATQGETVSFIPFLTAKSFISCVEDIAEKEVLWKVWYDDLTKDSSAPRESLELVLDKETRTFSLAMPSSQIQIFNLTYNILNEPTNNNAFGLCALPEKWEVDTGSVESNSTATNPVKQTGQTTSYAAGDDGSYRAGATPSYARSSAGVVTDTVTGLEWQDDYADNGGGITSTTWQGSIDYCSALGLDDGGWRLPNIEELESIVDDGRYNPAIDNTIFVNTASSFYWSSTTYANYTVGAWLVYFYDGYLEDGSYKADSHYVRCVRGGE